MENIVRIKSLLSKINNRCDLTNKSIFSILLETNRDIYTFFSSIGLDITLLNDIAKNALDSLVKASDTRFSFDPSMSDNATSEIALYSKSLNLHLAFTTNEIRIITDKKEERDSFVYNTSEYMGIKKGKMIHFSTEISFLKEKVQNKPLIMTFTLDHAIINMAYQGGEVFNTSQIVIDDALTAQDFNNILKMLYRYEYDLALNVLKLYPANVKNINNDAVMNNFNTR